MTATLAQRAVRCRTCGRILVTSRDGTIPDHFGGNPADKRWCIRSGQPATRSERQ